MKFDMHCHTKEGSFDSKIPVSEYITKYLALGYDGFLITDHNSYRGCRHWHRISSRYKGCNITVLCGIEYDTKDAGHVLVIMPDGLYLPLLCIRGMRCRKLINTVHAHGGILGLAHPFGAPSSSAMGFKLMDLDLLEDMDFLEAFNTCENPLSNKLALELANKYRLPCFAGTDAHNAQYIGMASTEIDWDIRCNNDLIAAIKAGVFPAIRGSEREKTLKGTMKDLWISQLGFKLYNRGLGKVKMPYRKFQHYKLFKDKKEL